MADALAKLVRTVWQEMELAGEAGSLLKIEEILREAIATARKESEEKAPLFRVLEYGLSQSPKEKFMQMVAGEDQDFFAHAEELVLFAVRDYAEQAVIGEGYRRRLFVGDATQGFAFIDICRKLFDIVVMNPPFGLAPKSVNSSLTQYYKDTYVDLYACFVARGLNLCPNGIVGAITSRAFEMTKKLARWRENQLINSIDILIDLGLGVMDDAFVEAASYTLRINNPNQLIFAFNRRFNQVKNNYLSRFSGSEFYLVNRSDIQAIPGQKLLYSLPHKYFRLLKDSNTFEPLIGTAREGLRTFDDFRFVRLRWEVPYHEIGGGKTWEPYAKGGEFSRYYSDIHLLVKWNIDGRELSEVNRLVNGQIAQSRQASEYYHRCGVTYSKRSAKGFSGRALPAGCIIGTKGPAILSESLVQPAYLVGWINSNLIVNLIHIQANAFEFNTGIIKNLPWRNLEDEDQLTQLAENTIIAYQNYKRIDETNSLFFAPVIKTSLEEISQRRDELLICAETIEAECQSHWNSSLQKAYDVSDLLEDFSSDSEEDPDDEQDLQNEVNPVHTSASSIISYSLGAVYGRWNVQYVDDAIDFSESPDPFAELPICPPGMLLNNKGLPTISSEIPVGYPLHIFDDGILADDEGNDRDIVHLSRKVLNIIFGKDSEVIEQSINQLLSLQSYRDYFQKPSGFFAYHLGQYSKSRRQAPIYWPLSTPSCSYTLWLYYHRLNNQTLYTCVNDFVDPKLKQVSEEAARLRLKKGRSAADEKELERLTEVRARIKGLP